MPTTLLRHLLEVAHAGYWRGSDHDLALAVERGWVRHVPPDALALIAHHRDLKRTCEALTRDAARCGRGPGNALLSLLWPPRRRALKQRADALRDQAEAASRAAQGCWLTLSQRDLLTLEPELLARAPGGALLGITDAGREALRNHVWSAACDVGEAGATAPEALAQAFIRTRGEALTAGFPPDPRLDLAAALAATHPAGSAGLLDLNARAVAAGWRHFDRLPILGALLSLDADPERAWERHARALDWLQRSAEFPPGYETRLTAFLVAGSPCVWLAQVAEGEASEEGGELARARLIFVLSRLRAEGWSLAPATIPTSVRLAALPIPQAQVVARVRSLVAELKQEGEPVGPHSDLAAALAAGSNLHPLAVKHTDARVSSLSTAHGEFLDRLAQAREALPGREPSGTLLAAYLALLPGDVAGTLQRATELQKILGPVLWPGSQAAVIAALLGASAGPWFSSARYVWELCALLDFDDLTSVYTARQRLSPAQTASRVGASGPAFGPGTSGG